MAEFELREGDVPGLVDRLTELHAAYYGRRWKLGPRFESDIVTGIAEFAGRYDPSRDGIWTVDELEAAIRLYRDVGFTPTETIDSMLTGRQTFRTACSNGRTNLRVADRRFPVLKRLFSSSRTIRL